MSKSIAVPVLTAALLFAVSAAFADGLPFTDIDTNGDGFLDEAEVIAAFGPAGHSLLANDLDADGVISPEEILAGRGNEVAQTHAAAGLARAEQARQDGQIQADQGRATADANRSNGQARADQGRANGDEHRGDGQSQAASSDVTGDADGQNEEAPAAAGNAVAGLATQQGGQAVADVAKQDGQAIAGSVRQDGQARADAGRGKGEQARQSGQERNN